VAVCHRQMLRSAPPRPPARSKPSKQELYIHMPAPVH